MSVRLQAVKDTEFDIYHGDTLTNDWDMLRETNPAKKPKFDAVVANPPFSYRWDSNEAMGEDVRYKSHGLAPKSAADFAFLLHGFHYLKDEGVMVIILPGGWSRWDRVRMRDRWGRWRRVRGWMSGSWRLEGGNGKR